MKTGSKIAIVVAAVGVWLLGRKNKSVSGIGDLTAWNKRQLDNFFERNMWNDKVVVYTNYRDDRGYIPVDFVYGGYNFASNSCVISPNNIEYLKNLCGIYNCIYTESAGSPGHIPNIQRVGKVDYSDFDGARIIAKDGLHGIEFNIYGGGGVVVSSVYKGKGKYGSIWEYLSHVGEYKTLSGAIKAAKKYWDMKGIKYNEKDFENI